MKKLFAFVASIALMFAFTSCSDSNDDNNNQGGGDSDNGQDQILVMFYGVGGDNLDGGILGNIFQSLNAGSSGKLKMTYQYRFSQKYQSSNLADYHNILRFTADDNKQLVGNINIDSTLNENYCFKTFEGGLNATHFGDANFIMASDTALVSFIKWSKAKYPNAKKTVMIISDHGGGWNIVTDGKTDYNNSVRGILYDDNTRVDDASRCLSVGDVKRALNTVGKVDLLYTDACLMSTWENLTGYADVANYYIGSLELAPGIGGNYDFLMNRLKEADVTDEGVYAAAKKYVDNVINDWWEKVNKSGKYTIYGDLAAFDLRNISEPLTVLSDIRKALVEKYNDETPLTELTDTTQGTTWKEFIDAAISGCVIATSFYPGYVPVSKLPAEFLNALETNRVKYIAQYGDEFSGKNQAGEVVYYGPAVVELFKNKDIDELMKSPDLDAYIDLWDYLAEETTDSYPVCDLLENLNEVLQTAGSTDKTFTDLNARYYNALKNFGYISCTLPVTTTTYPCAYQLCSPGLTVFPFNADGFDKELNFCARYSKKVTLAEAIKYYQASDFDKKVQWCEFLKIIDRAPDLVGNPSREEFK